MKLKILTLGAGLALAAGAAAVAQDTPRRQRVEDRVVVMNDGPGGHGAMDADNDGAVSRDEFRGMHDRMFDKLDTNRDGRLAGDEFHHRGGPGGERFEFRLSDGPGHPGGPGGRGPRGDHFELRHGGPGHDGPGRDNVRIIRRGGEGEGRMDKNNDGRVSLEEFTAPMREHFREADKNNNGFLDKDEMEDGRVVVRHIERRE